MKNLPTTKGAYKRVLAGLLMLLIMVAPIAGAFAAEYSAIINPYNKCDVAMRDQPGDQGKLIACYPIGTKVELLEHGTWMKVKVGNCVGYIHADYINLKKIDRPTPPAQPVPCKPVDPIIIPTPVNPPAKDTAEYMYVNTFNGGNLNLRSLPSGDSCILFSFPVGTRVKVLLKGQVWYKVEVNGLVGYMDKAYLSAKKPSAPACPPAKTPAAKPVGESALVNIKTGSFLNLRELPNPNAKILGKYYTGARVYVQAKVGDWYQVTVGGVKGYMLAKYVKLDKAAPVVSNTKTVINNNGGSYANLRSYAGMHYDVLLKVKVGTKVQVLEKGEYWTKVSVCATVGYINNYFLK